MKTKVIEKSILYYTNKERRKRGLKPLAGHKALIKASRTHSKWMARVGKFSHIGADGSSHTERAKSAGYIGSCSENIWRAPSTKGAGMAWKSKFVWDSDWRLGKAAVISWMNSPGHRANLLSADWKHIGVGVARNKRGSYYLTQQFGGGAFGAEGIPTYLIAVLLSIIAMGLSIEVCA